MIVISGLIPDFSSEAEMKKPEIIAQFSYDNTLEEIDCAMKTYQGIFGKKRNIIMISAYGLLTIASVVLIILNYSSIFPYVAFLVCVFSLVYNITDKKRTRNRVLDALKGMNPEDYNATLYPEKIEIETIIKPKEDDEIKLENDEDTENIAPIKSIFIFEQDMLDFAENEQSLLLFVARRQTYCFPKRCLTEEQISAVRDFLKEKLGSIS